MLIKYIWFQNNPGEVNTNCVYIAYSIDEASQNLWRTGRAKILRSRYFFFNITRRQAISHVAKFCHVLGHGSMIKLMVFIFIKCFLAN